MEIKINSKNYLSLRAYGSLYVLRTVTGRIVLPVKEMRAYLLERYGVRV